jgi:hypothetical protein
VSPDTAVEEVAVADEGTAATVETAGPRVYPSLYDTTPTTLAAIGIGLVIVGGIQVLVAKLYASSKSEHAYLTRFVTALVALVMGAYIADLLIAGPDTSLLTDDEHTLILSFVKDTCLMVFSYYFGLKAQAPAATEDSHATE